MLSDCERHDRGYNVSLKDQTINIRIPSDKEGVNIEVNKDRYSINPVEIFDGHNLTLDIVQ